MQYLFPFLNIVDINCVQEKTITPKMSTTQAELVFVPLPVIGHLLSAIELAKRITQRDERISIVILILNFPTTYNMINTFVDTQSRNNPYPTRLTFIKLPPLSNPPEPSSPNFFKTLVKLHIPLVKQAVEDRTQAGSSRLSGFILDVFLTPFIDIAVDLKVPSYIFFTSNASLLNIAFHVLSMIDDKGVDINTEFGDSDAKFEAPGFVNRVPGKVVPADLLIDENGASVLLDHVREYKKSKGILVNTFAELETYGMPALLDHVAQGSIPAVYPVGPILELDNVSRSGTQDTKHESIMTWLDGQPSFSVVYLCFGSMGSFDADQVKEIANGLETSGHRFLWSLRKLPTEGKFEDPSEKETYIEALPKGFLDRTTDRGKIIGWAPQVSILAHPSVGGFVSHCGWNSTLESLWFGVPMATWPLYAEQQLNAFELVKELGLAVEIRMDYRRDFRTRIANFQVTAEEIENGVNKLMSMDEETKNKVREMRDKGRKTIQDGGSSHQWLGRFIEDVLTI